MKKSIYVIFLISLMTFLAYPSSGKTGEKKSGTQSEKREKYEAISKTYTLKHIAPGVAMDVLKPYVIRKSYSNAQMMLTVTMLKSNQKKFEEILRKMDVKKKDVKLTIYAVIASNYKIGNAVPIKNETLNRVLEKLNNIMKFKHFSLDGVAFLPLKDGQKRSKLKLSSRSARLELLIWNVNVKGNASSQRSVKFGFRVRELISKYYGKNVTTKDDTRSETLIETDTSIKENGYLVAGVSKIGKNGDSLVLVMSGKIE